MKRIINQFIYLFFISIFVFTSCVNEIGNFENLDKSDSTSKQTYISIGSAVIADEINKSSRTIIANNTADLTDFVLNGTPSGGSERQLATAENITKLSAAKIPVTAGEWDFTLSANFGEINFSGTVSAEITDSNTTNNPQALFFVLSSNVQYGGLNITMTFTGAADKVVVSLKDESNSHEYNQTFTTTDFTSSGNNTYKIVYSWDVTDPSNHLEAGTYFLSFEFYKVKDEEQFKLNTSRNLIRIANGINTTASLSVTLNEAYEITYKFYVDGSEITDTTGISPVEGVLTNFYLKKTPTFTLPEMSKSGYIFDAWYKDSDFTEENKITSIEQGSTGNLELYANFVAQGGGGYSVTRTNPDAALTPTSGSLIFEVSGISNLEEPWNEVQVEVKYFDSGEDCWVTYDADEGHNWSSNWESNIYTLYLYSFSPDDRYMVAFYDSDDSPLCSDYEFEFTVAELPAQSINIDSLDSDGLTSAVQSAVEIFGGGKVKLNFTGTNNTDGVNLYSIVAGTLSNYQAAELDFSECSGNVVSEVPDNTFWNKFDGNGTIALSNSTTKIGSQAFAQNSTITVSNLTNVTEIGEKAFYSNSTYSGVGDISLDSVTSIGNAAFGNCVIGTLYLGSQTSIEINNNAFYDSESSWNQNSTKINVLNIGNFTGDVKTPFNKCYSLSKFVVPDTNTVYYTDSEGSKLYLKADNTEYMSTK